jgi:hypothetical protein
MNDVRGLIANFYSIAELKELSEAGVIVSIHLDISNVRVADDNDGGTGDGGGGGGGVLKPDTILVVMTQKEAYKHPVEHNAKGKPIMDNVYREGFRAEEGEILQVYFPANLADGGGRYYRVWRDEKGMIVEGHYASDTAINLYVNKGRTSKDV